MIAPIKYKPFIDIMGHDIHQVGYYLEPAYQYKYALGTRDSLLFTLHKVIQRMSATNVEVAQVISESRYFRDESGNFEKLVYVHYNMRLRMRALKKEDRDEAYVDLFDAEFIQSDTDPMMDWWSAIESDQPLLDEPGDPHRPSPIACIYALESKSQQDTTA
ncbi:hypothetical protein Cni_G09691 [Canna indica]|uniref:Uncharacterized protein n=1 Tax=Canna indica TaxID=4628 RepID=A0AAQ3K2Y5_9LILI|nr:hypothetical protein Cni_G09691 [Canna indica]